MAAKFDP